MTEAEMEAMVEKAAHEAAHIAKLAAEATQAAIDMATEEFKAETDAIKSGYTQAEIDSWPTQEAEAEAYAADPTADTPFLDAVVSETGEDKDGLVGNIRAKAALFKVATGRALGRKRVKGNE
jgi:hypothetical protein